MTEGLKIIYSDDEIEIAETGRDYDFIAIIENKTDEEIDICPDDDADYNTNFEPFKIAPYDWIGLLAEREGWCTLNAIKQGKFYQEFVY